MEIDGDLELLRVAIATGTFLDRGDLGIQSLGNGVGNAMREIGKHIRQCDARSECPVSGELLLRQAQHPKSGNAPTTLKIARSHEHLFVSALADPKVSVETTIGLLPYHLGSDRITRMVTDMRLADFILHDIDQIVVEWEIFAATQLPAAADMPSLALRDHAKEILEAVAADLKTTQTRAAQQAKSKGLAPIISGASETAAQTHAVLRARSGFNINQLAAEYRALRASVLRLWMQACPPGELHLDDIIRFNEAIDQALVESINFFTKRIDQTRDLLLGMLGHDMRSPLQTIQMTATYLAALNAGADISEAAERLVHSGARIKALLDDLVDFNRTQLGLGIKIVPEQADLASLFADELQQLRAAHPGRRIDLEVSGDVQGRWDGRRLQQVLGNLVENAVKYGAPDMPIRVLVTGADHEVRFEVRNSGAPIERTRLEQIFEPLKRGLDQEDPETDTRDHDGSLGLGLYIAREIALAHRGHIEARSEKMETAFVVSLPRAAPLS